MNKFKTSAIEILKEANQPLHYREITRLALEKGILETEGATPEASMNSKETNKPIKFVYLTSGY
ncbi:MAG: winged helix-turn-helix domain-containing protein [bacterium]